MNGLALSPGDQICLAVAASTTLVVIIVYGLFRSYSSGVLILFSWWPKIIHREETPLQYWFWFGFYLLLIPLIILLAIRHINDLSHM